MDTLGSTVADLALTLLLPLISGPVAAVVYMAVVRREGRWRQPVFWLSLLVADLAVCLVMAVTLGDFIGPGALACALTPVAAVVTLALGLVSKRWMYRTMGEDKRRWTWYLVGIGAIALLQLAVIVALTIIAPALCDTPLRTCSGS